MLPPDCFPKIADWIDIYIYIYTSFRRKRKAATQLYRARKTREKRADCLLIISWIVDLEKGRENIENIRRNVEILASVRMFLTVDKKVSICIVLLKIILNKIN